MSAPSLELLAAAGLSFEASERALLIPCANAPVDLLLVRAADIPEYVQDGVVHAGITGANLVAEAEARVETLTELGFARCTLEAAVPEDAPQQALEELDGLRVATAYPRSTRSPARSRPRRAWGSRTRSSTSSRPARPRTRTACGWSGACSSRRRCSS